MNPAGETDILQARKLIYEKVENAMASNTKQALAESLKKLMENKPLNKITIKDLTDDCEISRMTFYYHFEDIYALIRWICQEDSARAIGSCKHYDNWLDGFESMCRAVLENRTFVEGVYRSVRHDDIEAYLYRVMSHLILNIVRERTSREPIPDIEKEKIADFYTLAFVGIALKWVRNGFRESPEELARGLSTIVDGQIDQIIENYKSGLSVP